MLSYFPGAVRVDAPYYYFKNFKYLDSENIDTIKLAILKNVWTPGIYLEGRRCKKNFKYARLGAIDIDYPEYPLEQALDEWSRYWHIIGTTKSHQKNKKGVVCDRYRIVFKWSDIIDDYRMFEWNQKQQSEGCSGDIASTDSARFFWPCKEIVSVNKRGCAVHLDDPPYWYMQPFKNTPVALPKGAMPLYVHRFLTNGKLFGDSRKTGRNTCCFRAAIILLELGFDFNDILNRITKAPFDRTDFRDNEIQHAVYSALKHFKQGGSRNGK